jgi:hypothetical protein
MRQAATTNDDLLLDVVLLITTTQYGGMWLLVPKRCGTGSRRVARSRCAGA